MWSSSESNINFPNFHNLTARKDLILIVSLSVDGGNWEKYVNLLTIILLTYGKDRVRVQERVQQFILGCPSKGRFESKYLTSSQDIHIPCWVAWVSQLSSFSWLQLPVNANPKRQQRRHQVTDTQLVDLDYASGTCLERCGFCGEGTIRWKFSISAAQMNNPEINLLPLSLLPSTQNSREAFVSNNEMLKCIQTTTKFL